MESYLFLVAKTPDLTSMPTIAIRTINLLKHSVNMRRLFIVMMLAMVGYYVYMLTHQRSHLADFRVYYGAASDMRHDESMYGVQYGTEFGVTSGYFKYSPLAAWCFMPFTLLSYPIASGIYYFITAILIGYFLLRMAAISLPIGASRTLMQQWWIPNALIIFFLVDHLERELILGNVNLILLLMALAVYECARNKRDYAAGGWFALLLLFKPHFAILIPYFIWKQSWKVLLTSIFGMAIGLILPALWVGWTDNAQLLTSWMHAINDHNHALYTSPNSIYGIVNRFILGGHGGAWLVPAALVLIASSFALWLWNRRTVQAAAEMNWTEYFVLIALIPNLVHTDTEHFLWTWPLIAMTIYRLWLQPNWRNPLIIGLLILAWFPYALNSPDLLGKTWSQWCDNGGLLGLANLMIVVVAIWIEHRSTHGASLPV